METSKLMRRYRMRVSRVDSAITRSGFAFALFHVRADDTANVEWREEFALRREAYTNRHSPSGPPLDFKIA